MSLDNLGWNTQWRERFEAHSGKGLVPARVVGEHRSHYRVTTGAMEFSAGTTGRMHNAPSQRSDLPGVGDFVAIVPPRDDGTATIEAVLPRMSALLRRAAGKSESQLLAANIDAVFIVTALGGDFNLARMKRYLALVQQSGAVPVIIANKSDLGVEVLKLATRIDGIPSDVPVHAISARSREGVQALEQYFEGNQTVALIGSSGVGKSTLTNQLLGHDAQATQEVRRYDGQGRHITTYRRLLARPQGGAIIDTPGMRGLELWKPTEAHQVEFEDIEAFALQCRFRNCQHSTEPGCAVRSAVQQGELDAARLLDYIKLAKGRRPSAR